MTESVRDRWVSIGMSVMLHGSLIALLALGVWHFRHPAPPPSLPINATVVDARTLKGVGTASVPAPTPKQAAPQPQPPPAAPAEGPPPPTPDEIAMRQQAAKEEAEHQAEAQKELLARQQAEEARQEAQRKADEAAAEQAEQAKKAEEAAAAAQAKKLAAAQKAAEAKKKAAAAKLAAQKKLAQERAAKKLAAEREREAAAERAARVAELRQSLQEDERASAASGALASWQSEITSRIQNAWIKPPTARPGIKCVLDVSLVSGGSVTGVNIDQCNGDDAVRQSIQTAVYNASPLPPPPNGIPFPRQLIITFQPTH